MTVTHVNCNSNLNLETAVIFQRHEQEKKRVYHQRVVDVENGTFTPLVLGTNGGMGKGCSAFVKHLCFALSDKQNEKYGTVVNWLRTKLSFEIVKSSLLCVRGSRRPWSSNFIAGNDFFLRSFEAGI